MSRSGSAEVLSVVDRRCYEEVERFYGEMSRAYGKDIFYRAIKDFVDDAPSRSRFHAVMEAKRDELVNKYDLDTVTQAFIEFVYGDIIWR